MRVCVIADQEPLGARIRKALIDAGQECPPNHVVGVHEAESYLIHSRPDLVVATTGQNVESAVDTLTRLRDLIPGYLLAVGPISEPKQVLRILRGGASDYVDEAEVESELAASLLRLRFGRVERSAPGRFLAVLSPSGGSGSSLVAVNLAAALAKKNERSLLIDLKSRCGDLAAMLDLKPSYTMQDLCRLADRIDRVLFEQSLCKHTSGISLLAAPRSFDASFSAEALTKVIELGRALFPRVVADIDPALSSESLEVVRLADTILMVMRLEFNSLRNAKAMIDHMERRDVDMKRLVIIGNRLGQSREIPSWKIEEALALKFFALIPDDPKAALASQNNGVPVLKEYPSSRLAKALVSLASTLDTLPTQTKDGV